MSLTIQFQLPDAPSPVLRVLADVVARKVRERSDAVVTDGPAPCTVALVRDPAVPAEGFRITDAADGVAVAASDDRGFVAGVGKLLRTANYTDGFTPGPWRGQSTPDKPFRAIYFATHFHNWYHEAPLDAVERYLQDLALWGYNTLAVWFDMHHYTGIDDPAAQAMLARLRAMLQAANRIGMGASLTMLANEAYATSPEALRADWRVGQNGYEGNLYHYHVEVCPNTPGGLALILQWQAERLVAFADIDVRHVILWPYDQGGCTCAACAPWGANGFLKVAEPLARLVREQFPQAQRILSTWDFDLITTGEWEGLGRAFTPRPDWADAVMAEYREDLVPEYLLTHGVPGGLPLVGFPEISMYRCFPWGGFGVNPLPTRSQRMWDAVKSLSSGGMPYSEGIFEDLNKAIFAGFYWDADRPAWETVREYLAFEFGPDAVAPMTRAIALFEETLPRARQDADRVTRFVLAHPEGVEEAAALVQQVEVALPARVKAGWRWRLVALRAQIDRELIRHDFRISEACEAAFEELERLYCATPDSCIGVAPPTKAARERPANW